MYTPVNAPTPYSCWHRFIRSHLASSHVAWHTGRIAPMPLHRFIRCSILGSSALYKLSDVYSGQYIDAITLVASDHLVPLGFLPRDLTPGQSCSDALALVYPMATGCPGALASDHSVQLGFAELVRFILSLSFFFVFCFAWPFCFIPGIYNYSLDKHISHIDCVVTQSPKSQKSRN